MTQTLLKYLMVGAVAPLMALAQVRPVPPVPPVAPVPPVPPVAPVPPVRPYAEPQFDYHYDYRVDEARARAEEIRAHALERARFDSEHARELAAHARELAQHQARESRELALHQAERARNEASFMRVEQQELARQSAEIARQVAQDFRYQNSISVGVGGGEKLLNAKPRAPWASEDPADSLYRLARESLNRGEYRRAAQFFNEVTVKFPKSQYALDCAYWEAFARYRTGTTDDLKEALKILDNGKDKFAYLRSSEADYQGLTARVLSALAGRGDNAAARRLQSEASQTASCDREAISVQAEALSALMRMDMSLAMPQVKKVLARRDECTVELRRGAIYGVGRQPNSESTTILMDVAKNDTDAGLRSEAMSWLSRTGGDQAVPLLEELLKTSTDERTQRSAVSALGSIDTERARKAVRAIIERTDVLERVRTEAISSLARDRDNRMMSADDMQYLRGLYAKMETTRLKESVLSAVGRVETAENEQFLLNIARTQTEAPSLRASALSRLGRMLSVNLNDIGKLYESADSRAMREQILRALSERKEPEAIDKLVEVAKKDTDYNIRRYAINLLSRSNNPKALKGIADLAAPER
jgi:HEAT repeat protein/TolA-binding protein